MDNTFLSFFPPECARRLEEAAQVKTYARGETIFKEGDPPDCLVLVLAGSVRLVKLDPSGKLQTVAFVGANDYFGEFGILDGKPRSTGAEAPEDGTQLARIPAETVLAVIDAAPSRSVLSLALHIIGKVRSFNARFAEEQLRKERMTLVGEMSRALFHDFRNPLTVVRLVADALQAEKLTTDGEDMRLLLSSQVDRLEAMSNDVIEFCRGSPQIKAAPVNLKDLLSELNRLNIEHLKRVNVRLEVVPLDQELVIDGTKILRVLQNLVGNAAEAFKLKEGTIRVSAERRGDKACILVADNGPGIPEAVRSSVFEPFTSQGKPKGMGLGMGIAKSFVEAHQGRLWFETATGQGTTFFIELPCPAGPGVTLKR